MLKFSKGNNQVIVRIVEKDQNELLVSLKILDFRNEQTCFSYTTRLYSDTAYFL